jgi:hypothetical protein
LSIGSGRQPEGELFALVEEVAPAPKPANSEAVAPPTTISIDTVLPGLVDLSLSNIDQPFGGNLNLEGLKTAFVPSHLQDRSVGDVRPPPGF